MKFLDPQDALKQFGVYGTEDVADFGAGAGHFALAAARRLDGGRLFAIDMEKELLTRLAEEARLLGAANVHTIWGDVSQPRGVPLGPDSVDKVIAANILYLVADRNGFVEEVKRLLRPGGKVLLIEWKNEKEGGPHAKHKIAEDAALALFYRHGFVKERDIDAGEYHYGIILRSD